MVGSSVDIVVLGTSTIDYIGVSERITNSNMTTQIKSMESYFGGRGSNFAVFSRESGSRTLLISNLGTDPEGISYKKYLQGIGILTSGIYESKSARTGKLFAFKDDKTIVAFFHGASDNDSSEFKRHLEKIIKSVSYKALYATWPRPRPNMLALGSKKPSKNTLNVFAPAHNFDLYNRLEIETCLRNTDILILNEHEYNFMKKYYKSATVAAKKFAIKIILITLGSKGVVIFNEGRKSYVPSFKPKKIVDATGAGDAFAAVFLSNFIRTHDADKSAIIASAAASFVVEEIGGQENIPTKKEIYSRMKGKKIVKADSTKILKSIN